MKTHEPFNSIQRKSMKSLLISAILVTLSSATYAAGGGGNSNNTPADIIHPNIHQNNGPGNNANPNGANAGGGNLHGIANNPGQSGTNPNDDGVNGFRNELNTVHGGILDVTGGNASGNGKGRANGNGGPPERFILCLYTSEVATDEAGNVIFDELGDVTIEVTTELRNTPDRPAGKVQARLDLDPRNFDFGNSEDEVLNAMCLALLADDDDTDTEEPEVITIEEANEAEFVNTRTGAE